MILRNMIYDIDIFTVGSDWIGKFDYLKEFCDVIYLERTEGILSSELREEKRAISLGLVGDALFLNKVNSESKYVNGLNVVAVNTRRNDLDNMNFSVDTYDKMISEVEAIYLRSQPDNHYYQIKKAFEQGVHVFV